ncbi:MAG TPA: HIT domain-containing protein [Chthoniobacterales bacterium]|nr:HIT domain-containing protein [Chthoniobacterales bacterium]
MSATDFWEPCWACAVLAGEREGWTVFENDDVAVLLNPFALSNGHCLVVPRPHLRNLYEIPGHLAGPILSTAARVARAAKQSFSADGITLRQNNDPASDQHLFHFHLHVIPRFIGDEARFNAPPRQVAHRDQAAIAERLRSALAVTL